jgi:hypothetical protein
VIHAFTVRSVDQVLTNDHPYARTPEGTWSSSIGRPFDILRITIRAGGRDGAPAEGETSGALEVEVIEGVRRGLPSSSRG